MTKSSLVFQVSYVNSVSLFDTEPEYCTSINCKWQTYNKRADLNKIKG